MRTQHTLRALMAGMVLLATVVVGGSSPAHAAEPSWWNGSWSQRVGIKILTSDALPSGYSVKVSFDHAGAVSAGKSIPSGNDVRIVRWDGSAWTELDRVVAVGSSWATSTTQLYFRTQSAIPASTADSSYYLYFGNGSAGSPPANPSNVYDLFDDFSTGSLDSSKWSPYGAPGVTRDVVGGELRMASTNTDANYPKYGIATVASQSPGKVMEATTRLVSSSFVDWNLAVSPNVENIAARSPSGQLARWNSSSWVPYGSWPLTGTNFAATRISQAVTTDGQAIFYKDGAVLANAPVSTNPNPARITFQVGLLNAGGSFDLRVDDVVLRKFVVNEPSIALDKTATTSVGVVVDPSLTFGVAGHVGRCDPGAVTSGTSSTAESVSLGHLSANPQLVGQNLSVASNGGTGWTVFLRSSGPLSAPGGRTLANVPGTNTAPSAFPAPGTEAFGYQTSDVSLGSGAPARFSSNRWAALSTSNEEVDFHNAPSATGGSCISYRAQTGPSTPAGSYATTVIYTAVPGF